MTTEKCTEEMKIRVTPTMREQLEKLAIAEDRAPSEYIRFVLACHLYGHARKVLDERVAAEGPNGSS